MTILSREALLSPQIKTTTVELPELGGSVRVRLVSVKARTDLLTAIYANQDDLEAYRADQNKPEGEREGLKEVREFDPNILEVMLNVVDENFQPLFTVADYDRFANLSFESIKMIHTATMQLKADILTPAAQKKTSARRRHGGSFSA